jgi:uroporphyrinogen-III synthase
VHAQPEKDFRAEGLAASVLLAEERTPKGPQTAGGAGIMAGRRVLIPASDRARSRLRDELAAAGAEVAVVAAYRTIPAPGLGESLRPLQGQVDLALFASPSAVEAVAATRPDFAQGLPAGVIGPVTEAAARRAGMKVEVAAASSTAEGLVDAVRQRLQS